MTQLPAQVGATGGGGHNTSLRPCCEVLRGASRQSGCPWRCGAHGEAGSHGEVESQPISLQWQVSGCLGLPGLSALLRATLVCRHAAEAAAPRLSVVPNAQGPSSRPVAATASPAEVSATWDMGLQHRH